MSTSGGPLPLSTITAGAGITVADPTGPDATVSAMSAGTSAAPLAVDVALAAATQAVVLTTGSLAAGTWALWWGVTVENGGATAGTLEAAVIAGTATASAFDGAASGETELPAITGGSAALSGAVIVVVTAAGTFTLVATSSVAATAKASTPTSAHAAATGLVAQRVS